MNSMPPPETMNVLKPLRAQVGEQIRASADRPSRCKAAWSSGCFAVAIQSRHGLLELLGRHARMRGHDDLEDGGFAARERAFEVAFEQRGERLLVLPLRDAAGRAPSRGRGRRRAGNTSAARPRACRRCRRWRCARRAGTKSLPPFVATRLTKLHDGLFGLAVVPGRKRAVWAFAWVITSENKHARIIIVLIIVHLIDSPSPHISLPRSVCTVAASAHRPPSRERFAYAEPLPVLAWVKPRGCLVRRQFPGRPSDSISLSRFSASAALSVW